MKRIISVILLSLFLIACDDSEHFAPVTDISGTESIPKNGIHRVMRGETLYSIAFRYGLDYRYLAERNHIEEPFTIHTQQLIYLRKNKFLPPKVISQPSPIQKPKMVAKVREPNFAISKWSWPAQGKIVSYFSATNKGVNIAGQLGEAIHAAGAGKVVYAGNGLRGYGNLIIIKHNNLYLSAYAHNSLVLVKEGDWIKQGQKIAEMGKTGTMKVMLHFEIRRAGKSLDPLVLYQHK